MNYSSVGKRFLAFVIDIIVVNLISSLFFFVGVAGFIMSSGLSFLLYSALMMGSPWHATLGQKAFGMVVVDENGVGIDYGKSFIRAFCFWLSSVILLIGHIVALFSSKSQTLQDKIAGTYVVDSVSSVQVAPVHRASGQGVIIGVSGEKAGQSFIIPHEGLMIGRDPVACQVVMNNSTGVSKLHCFILYNPQNGMYVISDRNSTYGTYTESGRRIHSTNNIALKKGQRFYVGSNKNMFELG